jgi:hypothetical protein
MYIDTTTLEYPLFQGEIMQRHPSTIFPTPFVPPEQYALVQPSAPPAHDGATQKAIETQPAKVGQEWLQQWAVVDLTEQEMEDMRPPVPQACTRRQGLLALLSYGFKRADIEAQIETIEDETEREAAWIEYLADTWDIGNPRLQGMWAALGGTQQQLPDLFRLAVTL